MRLNYITTVILAFLIIQTIIGQENSSFEKKGFVIGTSFGVSKTTLKFPEQSENHTDLGIDLKIGYMIKSNLAVLLISNISIYDYSGFGRDRKRDFGVLAPSIQYWLRSKTWIQGGIGIGGDNPVFWDIKNPDKNPLETKYYSGLGAMTAIGYELYQSKKTFTVDIKIRALYRKVELQEGRTTGFSYGVQIGVNMY